MLPFFRSNIVSLEKDLNYFSKHWKYRKYSYLPNDDRNFILALGFSHSLVLQGPTILQIMEQLYSSWLSETSYKNFEIINLPVRYNFDLKQVGVILWT